MKHDVVSKEETKDGSEPPASARRQWGVPGGTVVKQLQAAKLNESAQSDVSNTSLEDSKGEYNNGDVRIQFLKDNYLGNRPLTRGGSRIYIRRGSQPYGGANIRFCQKFPKTAWN